MFIKPIMPPCALFCNTLFSRLCLINLSAIDSVIQRLLLITSVLTILTFSEVSYAAITTTLELQKTDSAVQISTTHMLKSWYLSSKSKQVNQQPLALQYSESEFDEWEINGGYEHTLVNHLAVYLEAGVTTQKNGLTNNQRYNLTTGLSYQLIPNFSLKSSVKQTVEQNSETQMAVTGQYQLTRRVNLKAIYQLTPELDKEVVTQEFQIGVGYRF